MDDGETAWWGRIPILPTIASTLKSMKYGRIRQQRTGSVRRLQFCQLNAATDRRKTPGNTGLLVLQNGNAPHGGAVDCHNGNPGIMTIQKLGPYRIERRIGRGGMGTVYAGVDRDSGRRAAIKVLSPSLASEEDFHTRFTAEIETLKKLKHANIVQLYGYGEHDGQVFYVMELIGGPSLQSELEAGRRFQWREVARIGIEVCRALKHAHDCGVIHRDLKPANLLLDAQERVKLTDFGIAKLFGFSPLTTAGDVIGTADYMSPEQAEGKLVTSRCDLYSLGSVLYALLAGRPPFRGKSLPEVIHNLRFSDPIPVGERAADVPKELERILSQLLEKDPQERIPTALAVANRLEAMVHALSLPSNAAEVVEETVGDTDEYVVLSPESSDDGNISPISIRKTEVASEETPSAQKPSDSAPDMPLNQQADVRSSADVTEEESTALPGQSATGARRFTTVEEDRRQAERVQRSHEKDRFRWLGLVGTSAAVAVVVGLGWYALRPLSADRLHSRIAAAAAGQHNTDRLAGAEGDIRQFLERFPNDPRRKEVEDYLQEIKLDRLQRKFERKARQPAATGTLSPVERAYLEAMQHAQVSPETAAAKLQALIDIFGGEENAPEKRKLCLALAQHQLEKLNEMMERSTAEHLELLKRQLDRANQIRHSEPVAAQAIWRGIVELYADKPWAAVAVRESQRRLEELVRPESEE